MLPFLWTNLLNDSSFGFPGGIQGRVSGVLIVFASIELNYCFLSSWTFVGCQRSGEHVWWIVTAGCLHHPLTTPHGHWVSAQIDSRPFCKHSYHLPLHPTGNKDSKSSKAAGLLPQLTCRTGKWNWRTPEDWNCSFLKLKLGPFCKHCQHKKFNSTN